MAAMPGLWIRILQVQVLMENKKEMRKAPRRRKNVPLPKCVMRSTRETTLRRFLQNMVLGKSCSLHAMNGGTKDSSLCFDLDRCMSINNQYKARRKSYCTTKTKQMQLVANENICTWHKLHEHARECYHIHIAGNKNPNPNTPLSSLIEITNDANNAYLFFASSTDAITATKPPHWNIQSRQEPFHYSRKANVGDHPFGPTQHAMAALGNKTSSEARFRSSYDVAVPMRATWKIPEDLQQHFQCCK